jgi:hypothetical protein
MYFLLTLWNVSTTPRLMIDQKPSNRIRVNGTNDIFALRMVMPDIIAITKSEATRPSRVFAWHGSLREACHRIALPAESLAQAHNGDEGV